LWRWNHKEKQNPFQIYIKSCYKCEYFKGAPRGRSKDPDKAVGEKTILEERRLSTNGVMSDYPAI